MGSLLAIGLLFLVPLLLVSGSDDAPEPEPEDSLGTDGPDQIDNSDSTVGAFYDLQGGNDGVQAGSGDDTIINDTGVSTIRPGAGNDSVSTGDGPIRVTDVDGDDTITGGAGNDLIIDQSGANLIDGGAGSDTLQVGDSSTVTGGDGSDIFSLTVNVDADTPLVITDFDPDEDFLSNVLNVAVTGDVTGEIRFAERDDGTGANIYFEDRLVAELIGVDVARLEEMDIQYNLDGGANFTPTDGQDDDIRGSYGADTINAGLGDDVIYSQGNTDDTGDLLRGGEGNDTITARGISAGGFPNPTGDGGFFFVTEQSTLEGGAGDDWLTSLDSNVMTGGEGADTFRLSVRDNTAIDLPPASIITDFVQGEDVIAINTSRVLTAESLSVVPWSDGTGADILSGDHVIAQVTGGQDLVLADLIVGGF